MHIVDCAKKIRYALANLMSAVDVNSSDEGKKIYLTFNSSSSNYLKKRGIIRIRTPLSQLLLNSNYMLFFDAIKQLKSRQASIRLSHAPPLKYF